MPQSQEHFLLKVHSRVQGSTSGPLLVRPLLSLCRLPRKGRKERRQEVFRRGFGQHVSHVLVKTTAAK